MTIHVGVEELVRFLFGGTDEREAPELTCEQLMLVECYLSGQVPEAAWQEHVLDEPVLEEYLAAMRSAPTDSVH